MILYTARVHTDEDDPGTVVARGVSRINAKQACARYKVPIRSAGCAIAKLFEMAGDDPSASDVLVETKTQGEAWRPVEDSSASYENWAAMMESMDDVWLDTLCEQADNHEHFQKRISRLLEKARARSPQVFRFIVYTLSEPNPPRSPFDPPRSERTILSKIATASRPLLRSIIGVPEPEILSYTPNDPQRQEFSTREVVVDAEHIYDLETCVLEDID